MSSGSDWFGRYDESIKKEDLRSVVEVPESVRTRTELKEFAGELEGFVQFVRGPRNLANRYANGQWCWTGRLVNDVVEDTREDSESSGNK